MKNMVNAPKILRTYRYILEPYEYEIICPICRKHNIAWSEFENHIWCYDCEQDILLTMKYSGIFNGPIPYYTSLLLGLRFERVSLSDNSIIEHNDQDWNKTWVYNKELFEYKHNIEKDEENL